MATRLDMINNLATQAPIVNRKAAEQLQAGRQMQVQRAVSQAPAGVPAHRAAQSVAGQNAAAAGQISLDAQKQTLQGTADLAAKAVDQAGGDQKALQQTRALGQQETQSQAANTQALSLSRADNASTKRITGAEIDSATRVSKLGMEQDNQLLDLSLRQRRELASIGRDVKDQIFDSRLRFEKDENGRKFSNERQLADWAISNAKTEQELQGRFREMQQASDRTIKLLEHSNNQIMEAINRGWLVKEQKLDYEQKRYLLDLKRKMDEKIAKERAKAANRMAVYQGVGMVAGAVIGSMVAPVGGTALGATAGASAGAGVGTAVAGATA
jgi:hypothetical protein